MNKRKFFKRKYIVYRFNWVYHIWYVTFPQWGQAFVFLSSHLNLYWLIYIYMVPEHFLSVIFIVRDFHYFFKIINLYFFLRSFIHPSAHFHRSNQPFTIDYLFVFSNFRILFINLSTLLPCLRLFFIEFQRFQLHECLFIISIFLYLFSVRWYRKTTFFLSTSTHRKVLVVKILYCIERSVFLL